jgi:hypothetical protein
VIRLASREMERVREKTVGEAREEYMAYLRDDKQNRPRSLEAVEYRLGMFFSVAVTQACARQYSRCVLRLAELLSPLAAAADHGAGLPPETGARTALIGLQLAQRSGLGVSLADAFYAGLLRHLGCSVTAHEETRLMGDEQELRVSFSAVDGAKPIELLKAAAGGFGRGKSRTKRVARVARFMLQAPTAVPPSFTGEKTRAGAPKAGSRSFPSWP